MASIFYQTLMFLLFCCTWGAAFFAVWVNCADIYKAVCVASILWSTFVFVLIEGLNLFKAITATNLMTAWGIFLILWGGYIFPRKKILRDKINSLKNSASSLYRDNGASVKALIIFIAFFMLARTVLAVVGAPDGYDVVTYHLPRVMFWLQHHSVDYYPTTYWAQIYEPVFAEYVNLNVWLLTGGDLFVAMFQNLSGYGCCILLYAVMKKLGCSIKWALFSCILAISMNLFNAEMGTADADLVGTFYLMVLIYLILEVLYDSKLTIFQFTLLGIVSGILYIAKTNVCVPAAMVIIYVALVKIFQKHFRIIPLGIISLIFIAVLVFPTFYRNYQEFGDIFTALISHYTGSILSESVTIGTLSPKYVIVNIIKNLCTLGVERNTVLLGGLVKTIGRVLKVDINAPEISYNNMSFQLTYFLNGAHVVIPLFLISALIALVYLIKRHTRTDGLMFVMILQLFVMLVVIRWAPFQGHIAFPSLVISVIPIAYYFMEITKKFSKDSWKYKVCYFLVLDIIFACWGCSIENLGFSSYVAVARIHHPRFVRYFGINQHRSFFIAYDNFSKIIDAGTYENIGLDGTPGMYQYPVLAKYVPEGKKIECVRLQGNGREIEPMNPNFSPDIILVENVELDTEKIYTCNGNDYKCVFKLVDDNNNGAVTHYSAWEKVSEKVEEKK